MIAMFFFAYDWLIGLGLLFLGGKKAGAEINVLPVDPEDNEEPDYNPGPVIKPDDEYLKQIEALIKPNPTPNSFYQIKAGGPTASDVAAALLSPKGGNTGSNRLALIKCLTAIPWNADRYSAQHPSASWGTLYDLPDGRNLSIAWFPRHAPAVQLLAIRESPPRTVTSSGAHIPDAPNGYYALLWLPPINLVSGQLVCDPQTMGPPAWLMAAIGGS